MHNSMEIIGRLVADADLRQANSGRAVIGCRVAVDRPGQQDKADFFPVIWWGPAPTDTARHEKFQKHAGYLKKGRLVFIQGAMQEREFTRQDNSKGRVWELHARSVKYLDKPKDAPPPPVEETDELPPF